MAYRSTWSVPRSATAAASEPNDQQPAGPQRQRDGHDEQREAKAGPPQQAPGQHPLQRKRQQARRRS